MTEFPDINMAERKTTFVKNHKIQYNVKRTFETGTYENRTISDRNGS